MTSIPIGAQLSMSKPCPAHSTASIVALWHSSVPETPMYHADCGAATESMASLFWVAVKEFKLSYIP